MRPVENIEYRNNNMDLSTTCSLAKSVRQSSDEVDFFSLRKTRSAAINRSVHKSCQSGLMHESISLKIIMYYHFFAVRKLLIAQIYFNSKHFEKSYRSMSSNFSNQAKRNS